MKAASDIFDICTYDWCQSLLGKMHYQNISSNRSLLTTLQSYMIYEIKYRFNILFLFNIPFRENSYAANVIIVSS